MPAGGRLGAHERPAVAQEATLGWEEPTWVEGRGEGVSAPSEGSRGEGGLYLQTCRGVWAVRDEGGGRGWPRIASNGDG